MGALARLEEPTARPTARAIERAIVSEPLSEDVAVRRGREQGKKRHGEEKSFIGRQATGRESVARVSVSGPEGRR